MCLAMKTRFCLLCFLVHGLCSVVFSSSDARKPDTQNLDFGDVRDGANQFLYDEANAEITSTNDSYPKNGSMEPLSEDHNRHYHSLYQLSPHDIRTHRKASEESRKFISKIFAKYDKPSVMHVSKFKLLWESLGLKSSSNTSDGNATQRVMDGNSSADSHHHTHEGHDHPHHDHDHLEAHSNSSEQHGHVHRKRRSEPGQATAHNHGPSGQDSPPVASSSQQNPECLSPQMLLSLYQLSGPVLDPENFLFLCPAILYQLDEGRCRISSLGLGDTHVHSTPSSAFQLYSSWKVWTCSVAAVVVISLVGLLGVAVIPLVQRVFFNHLLQFLVAQAVGALAGDALLHLLPHALAGEDEHSHENMGHTTHPGHRAAVWKGLCGLMGIFVFFLMERILTIISSVKRHRKSLKNRKKRNLCHSDQSVGEKLSDYQSCGERLMNVHPNKALTEYANENHEHLQMCEREQLRESGLSEEDVVITQPMALGHSHSAHHHSHHAHCDIPKSVAAVAWMVILGDGIHNFSDGLAIGAAFANSLSGGLSTSIAVFCHELPHEIGDFALLLRAGMTAKQAIVYNCVSSFLCFFGMVIGVLLGNVGSASLWVFAVVGGMFLYIAFVDMLPEVTSMETKEGENPFFHLLFQSIGMIIGGGIMLLIAVYENDLSTAFQGF